MGGVRIKESEDDSHILFKNRFSANDDGIMHACGHDGYIVIGLGAAGVILKIKKYFKGTIKLIFQPAEEDVSGARD